jgi:hypothetical protein
MDDEYVAQLLAKEAKESSIKYSTQGLSALMPSKFVCSHIALAFQRLHAHKTNRHLQADEQCPQTEYPLLTEPHQSNR